MALRAELANASCSCCSVPWVCDVSRCSNELCHIAFVSHSTKCLGNSLEQLGRIFSDSKSEQQNRRPSQKSAIACPNKFCLPRDQETHATRTSRSSELFSAHSRPKRLSPHAGEQRGVFISSPLRYCHSDHNVWAHNPTRLWVESKFDWQ